MDVVASRPSCDELVRGSGHVFRDLDKADADVQHMKALLAAEIIKALDKQRLTVRNADLERFSVERLMKIINRLRSRVEVAVKVRRKRHAAIA